jgi:hypothetical protein
MEEMAKKLGFKRFFKKLGPGFITGAADDDPSGIATYAQTGAIFGYRQLWLSVFTIPFMITVQEMCGRIGIVTGKGLAGAIGSRYGKIFLFFAVFLLFIANVVNIGADLGAMASAGTLLWGIPFVVWIVVSVIYAFSSGRSRILTILISVYMAQLLVLQMPFLGNTVSDKLHVATGSLQQLAAFIILFILLFIFLGRYAFKSSADGRQFSAIGFGLIFALKINSFYDCQPARGTAFAH